MIYVYENYINHDWMLEAIPLLALVFANYYFYFWFYSELWRQLLG